MKYYKNQLCLLLFVLASSFGFCLGQESDSLFNLGVKALSERNFGVAKELFVKDIDNQLSYESYYNLGLTYAGLENWNAAYWAFESALKIKPNDNEAAYNAKLALEHIDSKISWNHPYSWSRRMVLILPVNIWFFISFIFAIGLGVTLYFLITLSRKKYRYGLTRTLFIVMIPMFLITYFSGISAKKHFENFDYVIPTTKNVTTYIAMNGIALNEPLKNGMRYQFIKESGDWVQLKFSDNRPVWVKKEQVGYY